MSNQWHGFVGNLTRDPELRTVSGKNGDVSVVSFAVAVNGRNPEDTVFFECEAWAQGAEVIAKWFKKGTAIAVVDAEARNDSWTDKTTNEKRSRMKFRVNRFGFVGAGGKAAGTPEEGEATPEAPKAEESSEAPPAEKKAAPRARRQAAPKPEEPDDDIPF